MLTIRVVFLVAFGLSCAGTLIGSCAPIAGNWDSAVRAAPTTKCFSIKTYTFIGLFNSSVNVLTDFLFAYLPIPIILGLQIDLGTKISLAFVLSIGLVACVAGSTKMHYQTLVLKNPDSTWHDDFNVWNMVELCLGIWASSLPSMKPLLSKWLHGTRSAMARSSLSVPRKGGEGSDDSTLAAAITTSISTYHRQYDDPLDLDLHDYDKGFPSTSVQAACDSSPEIPRRPQRISIFDTVELHVDDARHDKAEEEASQLELRTDGIEHLDGPFVPIPPAQGIYRTIEISSTSELIVR